ncbi:lecithin retinol acyltransferase family protein [Pseudomonas sp. LS1212]|uniref:lecithin retinol acyltransferase family protein n=1 Tax=Pseudomonas sp. LS1212 TaxID=2972478 RepID=UPI00215D57A2|nr:lecithin retinol acyltransferase family protein [Pseudomonas sp. LS1212]UVJ46029.1 lecithin retinol acyltransferase family protein [Pseudomonas sp. LS1212]
MNMTTLLSATQAERIDQWMLLDLQGAIEAPVGSHLITPRNGYFHHGIYLGGGKVIHYCGLFGGLHGGAVKILSLERFAAGRTVQYRCGQQAVFSSDEVVRRALSRVGENHYRVLTNNCEHFCNWCLYGRSSSEQVRRFLTHPLSALRLVLNVLPVLVQQVRCAYQPV